MLAGTPYHRPAALAASKLGSYIAPAVHAPLASDDTAGWEHGARAIQPLLKAAFQLRLSAEDSMADALLRCERANARLRSALA
eukprot:1877542-Pleurochrysis_carterae.AAC.1